MSGRQMTISEYLERLQQEYVCAEIRSLIYTRESDKAYWGRVMSGKEEKIKDICSRNNLRNIFDSEEIKKRIWSGILGDKGLPKFIYKNDAQRLGDGNFPGMQEKDIRSYYCTGTEVRIGDNVNYETGIIRDMDFFEEKVSVEVKEEIKEYDFEIVTRIL